MIKQTPETKLKLFRRQLPIIKLIDLRQSGKTTPVKHVFDTLDYVLFKGPDNRVFNQINPLGFLSTYDKGAIIDERQGVPAF